MTDPNIAQSAKKFERIRKAHQSEVAEDYVEMIADLIERTGEARAVDLASLFGVTAPIGCGYTCLLYTSDAADE